jgi:hypothetical protein
VQATSIIGVGLAVAALVGGCNGEGEGATTAPTTSTTTSSVPVTTPAPTTTVDPLAAEEAAVVEAAEQARLARLNALVNPDDPAALASLDLYYVPESPARGEVNTSLADLAREGWAVRPHPSVPDSVTVEEIAFETAASPARATLVVCIIDSGIVYEPGAAPDGGEVIVNDVVYAARSTYEMAKVDGHWKLFDISLVNEWQGITECPEAP